MFLRIVNILTLTASVLLLVAMSLEILYPRELVPYAFDFSVATLAICLVFCLDFFVLMAKSRHKLRFFVRNFIVLLLSVPYHFLLDLFAVRLSHAAQMLLSGVVMLRAILALYITMRWLISNRTTRLLWAYIATVLVATYFAALIFYEFESPINSAVVSFGDALWWAWMNVTTVGASFFAKSVVGKLLSVLLPILGMAMFPVFTVYVTSLFERRAKM